MRIFVIIGRVLDPAGIVVNRRRGRIFVNQKDYILQPADRCALEAALRIKDAVGAEVVALPRGPQPDDDVMRQAVAAGADRAVHLTGEAFAEADEAAVTDVLAAAVERLDGADLILTGSTTLDAGQGQLGPRMAAAMGWPQVLDAWRVMATDGQVEAVLQGGSGYVTVAADLPAVVTLLPGALKLRYPDGARLINVYRGEGDVAEAVATWDVEELVDAVEPLLERRGKDFPPERERGMRVDGSPEEMAQAAAGALLERLGKVGGHDVIS
jgi:electron transfer flavoprotein beta subunit